MYKVKDQRSNTYTIRLLQSNVSKHKECVGTRLEQMYMYMYVHDDFVYWV